MKQKEIIQWIKNNKDLLPSDYDLDIRSDSQGVGIGVFKKDKTGINQISIWLDKKESGIKFIPLINLTQIENIVQPIFLKHKYRNSYNENDHGTIYLMSAEPEKFTETQPKYLPATIESEEDVIKLYQELNKYIKNVAEPFYKKWGDLKFLNNYIKTVPQMEIGDKIVDGAFKKAVIFKLCNDPEYDKYINWSYKILVDMYEKNKDGDIAYKRNADIIKELKEVLDKTEPIC